MNGKYIGFCFLLVLVLLGCKKEEDTGEAQAEIDREIIIDYLNSRNLMAQEHPSGLFYIIENPGTAQHPNSNSNVTIRYKGQLTDGTVFDQTQAGMPRTFPLNVLIAGWQIGLPLIGRNGLIRLYIPSGLGYGPFPPAGIPANAVLIFEIELLDF